MLLWRIKKYWFSLSKINDKSFKLNKVNVPPTNYSFQHQVYRYYISKQKRQNRYLEHNQYYCQGNKYQDYPLIKLIHIGIKKIKQFQQSSILDNSQFWEHLSSSGTKYLESASIPDIIKFYFIVNYSQPQFKFSSSIRHLVNNLITSLILLMKNQQLFLTFKSLRFKTNNQRKVQKIILVKLPSLKLTSNQIIEWLLLIYQNSTLTNKDPLIQSIQHNKLINLTQQLIQKIDKKQSYNSAKVNRLQFLFRMKSLFLKKQAKQRYEKLINLIAIKESENHEDLIYFNIEVQKYKNLQVNSLKTYTVKKLYLEHLFKIWNYYQMDITQIKSRYYQLHFQQSQISLDVHLLYYLLIFQIDFKSNFNTNQIKHILKSIHKIPFGIQWLVNLYRLQQNSISSLLNYQTKYPSQLISYQKQRIYKIKQVESIYKWSISLRFFKLSIAPFIDQMYKLPHLADLQKKLIIHCYYTTQILFGLESTSRLVKLQQIYWTKNGWNYLGLNANQFLKMNFSQRVKFIQKNCSIISKQMVLSNQ